MASKVFPFLFSVFFVMIHYAYADNIEVKSSLSQDTVNVGSLLRLTIETKYPSQYTLQMPLNLDFLSKIHLHKEFDPIIVNLENGQTLWSKEFILINYQVKDTTIPKTSLIFENIPDQVIVEKFTNELTLKFKSVLPKKINEIKDIKSVMYPKQVNKRILLILIIILIVILLFLIAKNRYFQSRTKEENIKQLSPYQLALEKIKYAQSIDINDNSKDKELVSLLSEAIKSFLGTQLHFNAMDLTTRELKEYLDRTEVQKLKKDLLLKFFIEIDFIKFSKVTHDSEFKKKLIKDAQEFINHLKQFSEFDSGIIES